MKAVQVLGSKESPSVVISTNLSIPEPQNDEILVQVRAAGITSDELSWPELYRSLTRIPGHDLSGEVVRLGPSYTGALKTGDQVLAMLKAEADSGCQAEYAIVSPEEISLKPQSLSHVQAAAMPIPFLTAWEALHEHAKIQRGSSVMVTGASGAVGLCMVQIAAKILHCNTTALASAKNHVLLREFGATKVIDYSDPAWDSTMENLDAVFDTVGGEILRKSQDCVKAGGTIVTIADPPPPWASDYASPTTWNGYNNINQVFFIVTSCGTVLSKLDLLIDEKKISPIPVTIFGAELALDAWKYAGQRGKEGKAIIEFSQ